MTAPLGEGDARVTRLLPLESGSVAGGVRVGGAWSLRVELGDSLFPISDRYSTHAMGEVGRSSRASVAVGLGLQLDTGQ